MRVIRGGRRLVHKAGSQPLDRVYRRMIVRIAGDDDRLIELPYERRDGPASLKSVPVPAKRLAYLEPNVPRADLNVCRIADTKIDVANVGAVGAENAKVIRGDESAGRVARLQLCEPQADLAKGQGLRWRRKRSVCRNRCHLAVKKRGSKQVRPAAQRPRANVSAVISTWKWRLPDVGDPYCPSVPSPPA
jgi:hypothetical protein